MYLLPANAGADRPGARCTHLEIPTRRAEAAAPDTVKKDAPLGASFSISVYFKMLLINSARMGALTLLSS